MNRRIINLDELQFEPWDNYFPPTAKPPLERFGAEVCRIGSQIGAQKLGYNVTVVKPGKKAYPRHAHRVNEELFLVLEGVGEVRIGAQKLGYNLTVVPPGKRAWPFHNHRVNEEMFFVLEGEGEVRIGDDSFPVRKGDLIACPPGGPETAHQLANTSADQDLKVLSVSTMEYPEIVEYPDTGKVAHGMMIKDLDGQPQIVRGLFKKDQQAGYWDGE